VEQFTGLDATARQTPQRLTAGLESFPDQQDLIAAAQDADHQLGTNRSDRRGHGWAPSADIAMAEAEGFEPPRVLALTAFKAVSFGRSDTPPWRVSLRSSPTETQCGSSDDRQYRQDNPRAAPRTIDLLRGPTWTIGRRLGGRVTVLSCQTASAEGIRRHRAFRLDVVAA
jgi:hypothetical protein